MLPPSLDLLLAVPPRCDLVCLVGSPVFVMNWKWDLEKMDLEAQGNNLADQALAGRAEDMGRRSVGVLLMILQ